MRTGQAASMLTAQFSVFLAEPYSASAHPGAEGVFVQHTFDKVPIWEEEERKKSSLEQVCQDMERVPADDAAGEQFQNWSHGRSAFLVQPAPTCSSSLFQRFHGAT